MKYNLSIEQRLLTRTIEELECRPGMNTPCWNCAYSLSGNGYPQINVYGKIMKASRVAYRLWVSEIPEGLHVCHTCDNELCINPDHLWLGTNYENRQDSVCKKRHSHGKERSEIMKRVAARGDRNGSRTHPEKLPRGPRPDFQGENHFNAKLTAEHVLYIRMWRDGGFTYSSIAKVFGITKDYARHVATKKTWKHVNSLADLDITKYNRAGA
jgi:hypothetical protein